MSKNFEHSTQQHLKRLLTLGVIVNMDLLQQFATANNLKIRSPKDTSAHIELPDGSKFKITFDFQTPMQTLTPPPNSHDPQDISYKRAITAMTMYATNKRLGRRVYVYILHAKDGDGRQAAYIGSTNSFRIRMEEHLLQIQGLGLGSSDLFEWAKAHNTKVRCAVLDYTEIEGYGESLEGLWMQRALKSGIHLPGAERWGRLLPKHAPRIVDENPFPKQILTLRPLSDVFTRRLCADDMYIGHIHLTPEQLLIHRRNRA